MSGFTLVDLDSQADAFARYARGWSMGEILDWLSHQGVVKKLENRFDDRLFVFRSSYGLVTTFRLTASDELVIVRAHSTYRPDQAHEG